MENLLFEPMRPGEEVQVSNLIWGVFQDFDAFGYRKSGIDEFKNFILPKHIKARCESGQFFNICCKDLDEIVGIISVRGNSHISLLFVKKIYHRKGIARKLFEIAVEQCCNNEKKLHAITVNSSPYAVTIYERMGFKQIDVEQDKNGIKFTPMEIRFCHPFIGDSTVT